ncbi:retrovirus-related pol polyprotein from transposon TNT 1-94 [Tanacetum coccineum]
MSRTSEFNEPQTITLLYVDDLIYTGNDKLMCEEFKKSMQHEFEMTDLGVMKYFLGVEVQQTEKGISIRQRKYAKKVLERLWTSQCVGALESKKSLPFHQQKRNMWQQPIVLATACG